MGSSIGSVSTSAAALLSCHEASVLASLMVNAHSAKPYTNIQMIVYFGLPFSGFASVVVLSNAGKELLVMATAALGSRILLYLEYSPREVALCGLFFHRPKQLSLEWMGICSWTHRVRLALKGGCAVWAFFCSPKQHW